MSDVPQKMEQDRAEVLDSAIALPFLELMLPEFEDPAYEPGSVRQPRRYGRPDGDTLPITRFLSDRGQVEILQPEMVEELFREIYWSCYQIRKLAESDSSDPSFWNYAVQHTVKCIQRMEAAEEELFIANRPLIVACAKPFYWIGQIWISDFLQEGSRALGNAIRKFDFTRGVPFYAYAQRSIQNRLRNYFRDHIRSGALGIKPNEDMIKIQKVIQEWRDRQGEDPSPLILSEMTQLPPERIKKLLPMVRQWQRMPATPLSLDAALGDTKSSLHDLVADHQHVDSAKEVERNEVWEAVARLPERLQIILKRRYVEGYTLDEVGKEFGLTRARIKQLQDEGLQKIRAFMRETYARENNKL
ncbi:sigma-70 family RNA polymerase sigma factor [Kiritimatiellaeota bacterium B1221]|nr:sigma-70 family RNA polymerase sigma factor [Kiritimatiellaeota bacterium B1221]